MHYFESFTKGLSEPDLARRLYFAGPSCSVFSKVFSHNVELRGPKKYYYILVQLWLQPN